MNVMKSLQYIGLMAGLLMPAMAAADVVVDFETPESCKGVSVYDVWEQSPFRTGVLEGNAMITPNPDTEINEITGVAPNPSEYVAGAQRSRFGSNRMGIRIDLAEPFELTPAVKYVHVMLHRPQGGRVMLVGLGSRTERTGQNPYTEQFWTLSSTGVGTDGWYDAVFAVKGAGGIDVRSLVVVPDCESPHNLDSDFLFYVDNIEINNSAAPRIVNEYYAICGDKKTLALSRSDRYASRVELLGGSDGDQGYGVSQQSNKLVYQDMLQRQFTAKPGDTVTPCITYKTDWMHAYCYLDKDNDGKFSYELTDAGLPAEGSDIVAFNYHNGKNSAGQTTNTNPASQNDKRGMMPSFTIPADMEPGLYRMRFKMDWDCLDPAGSTAQGNTIEGNGGVIIDIMLNVHNDEITVNDHQLNGEVLAADGTKLNALKAPFGQPFAIKMNPEHGFTHNGVTVRYGYGELDGEQYDKYGNPRYYIYEIAGKRFTDDAYTIQGSYMRGNVLINGNMVEVGSEPEPDSYVLNFPEDLTIGRTDRSLNSLTLTPDHGTALTIQADNAARLVYLPRLGSELNVEPGARITPSVSYTGNSMHTYFYVDLNEDGEFDYTLNEDGTPAGELLSYSHYAGKNSTGANQAANITPATTVPFVIPAETPAGVYRARFKIDWNNIDPAGQYSTEAGATNQINDNAGYILDFMIHVMPEGVDVTGTVHPDHGSVVAGENTLGAAPASYPKAEAITVEAASDKGVEIERLVVRRGYRLDSPKAMKMGNTYWTETVLTPKDGVFTIPADMTDRPLLLTAEHVGSVEVIGADADGNVFYNLLGVPVQSPTPGLYIHNGRKVIVR